MNARAKQNRLTQVQFFKLCEWVKSAKLEGHYTSASLAQAAPVATLGFTPIADHVSNALKATGIELPKSPAPARALHDRTQLLAQEMVDFMREFGKEPSANLLAISRRQSLPPQK